MDTTLEHRAATDSTTHNEDESYHVDRISSILSRYSFVMAYNISKIKVGMNVSMQTPVLWLRRFRKVLKWGDICGVFGR